jgi:hypothetical protein
MKTKTTLICLMAISLSVSLSAQKPIAEKYFKLYANLETSNYRFTNGNDTIITEDKSNSISFRGFSPAFMWTNENGNFQEVELAQLFFSREDEVFLVNNVPNNTTEPIRGARTTDLGIVLKYEYNWVLSKKPERLFPYIGLTSLLNIYAEEFTPRTSAAFPVQSFSISDRIGVSPRVLWQISPKTIVDFNIMVPLFEIGWKRIDEDNPLLPFGEQVSSSVGIDFLPKIFQFRIGLGIKV